MNEMQINVLAIEILNNRSIIFENTIQKCHDDGIKVIGNSDTHTAAPIIQKNYIEASTHNGIVVEGFSSCPMIRANIIEANRKSGIKLVEYARAHIGGQSLEDLNVTRNLDFKVYANIYLKLFQNTGEDGSYKDGITNFYEVLQSTADFKE